MEATTKDLRLRTNELLAAVDRGEEIVITYRGRKRAKLGPMAGEDRPARYNPAFGLWRDRAEEVDEYVRKLRQGRSFD